MPLFSDGDISSIDDLRAYDTAILDLAGSEGMQLTAKLAVAGAEIAIEIEEFLRKRSGGSSSFSDDAGAELSQVVVTTALKQWHTLRTLALIYGDVHGNHFNGRYEGKWKEYQRRSRWAAETLYRTGIGLVHRPVPRAEAPEVRVLPGAAPSATYHVMVAWKNNAGEHGAASEATITSVVTTGVIGVTAVHPPEVAQSFDVYVGDDPSEISKQNMNPVDIGAEWLMPETGLIAGEPAPSGQEPQWWLRNDRVLQRG